MKRIVLAASLLFSTTVPLATAQAAAPPTASKQSLVEYLGEITIDGVTYDVYLVTDLGGGVY
ncbi:hypothetical protein [Sphingomonas sp. LHG3443-2]|uniref:hypothetical protein n=1 Tax=Sphingomonas sp. LHG3443-2 TaxID=2804639 RepID=UPI003CEA1795